MPALEYEYCDLETQEVKKAKSKVCRQCDRYDAWMSHFATFPEALVEPCILAGTSERGNCQECGKPWERIVEKIPTGETQKMGDGWDTGAGGHGTIHRNGREAGEPGKPVMANNTTGWQSSCSCDAQTAPAVVLDPFAGSGTVLAVAQRLGRRAVGVELSKEYCELAVKRIGAVPLPLMPVDTGSHGD